MTGAWGVLGRPSAETIAGWANGPHGAFRRHVATTADPLWHLADADPELAAEIAAAGWTPRANDLLHEAKRLLDRSDYDARRPSPETVTRAVWSLFVRWTEEGLAPDEVPDAEDADEI